IEKYILSPRHIEVQVFGDSHGNIVHLFERDCSLQRRHQKVIEEAPAPGFDGALRSVVCGAAVKAAKAVDYVGAGTIEFIADGSQGLRGDRIWFMEMNTRLQVEHPVTEKITGQDLVEWQLRVASGEPLPKRQDELEINGWAMEARLYAEDPAKGFLPSIGRLEVLDLYGEVRVDTGVMQGSEVSPFYDPMIAKVIAHGQDRDDARWRLLDSLESARIWPIKNNVGFLIRALRDEDFSEARLDTGLIARKGDELIPSGLPSKRKLADAAEAFAAQPLAGFRLNAQAQTRAILSVDGAPVEASFDTKEADRGNSLIEVASDLSPMTASEEGQTWLIAPYRATGSSAGTAGDGAIVSPMPGRIIAVEVDSGTAVTKGQKLVTLEAMKMEHTLTAPFDGTVAELNATAGAQVSEGTLLVRVEAAGE
ncbi:MAG: methylcrotonoyl-CoA carboxylase, partial [Proteobacteria bacterium]|nr:methylcrotonoyl-CoA carboxylase [Pseudomonadota bacterium]